jgi:hypothetical protein
LDNVALMAPAGKPQGEMVTVQMTVSPAQAAEWLGKMPIQRRMRRNKVETHKRRILGGRWKVLPHGIVLDWNGVVIDGQHRLTALVECDRPLPMRVTFNTDPNLFVDIDDGAVPKDLADMLKHEGVAPGLTTNMAMIVRMLWRAKQGRSALENSLQPSNQEGREVYYQYAEVLKEASELAVRARVIAPSPGLLGYYLFLGLEQDAGRTRAFARKLPTGEDLKAGDPALLLRNTFLKDRAAGVVRPPVDQAIMAATAVNAAIRDRKLNSWRMIEFGKGKIPAVGR